MPSAASSPASAPVQRTDPAGRPGGAAVPEGRGAFAQLLSVAAAANPSEPSAMADPSPAASDPPATAQPNMSPDTPDSAALAVLLGCNPETSVDTAVTQADRGFAASHVVTPAAEAGAAASVERSDKGEEAGDAVERPALDMTAAASPLPAETVAADPAAAVDKLPQSQAAVALAPITAHFAINAASPVPADVPAAADAPAQALPAASGAARSKTAGALVAGASAQADAVAAGAADAPPLVAVAGSNAAGATGAADPPAAADPSRSPDLPAAEPIRLESVPSADKPRSEPASTIDTETSARPAAADRQFKSAPEAASMTGHAAGDRNATVGEPAGSREFEPDKPRSVGEAVALPAQDTPPAPRATPFQLAPAHHLAALAASAPLTLAPATGLAGPANLPLASAASHLDAPVALSGVAVEIATRALEGKQRFDIRLDPPELGRIDVRLDVGRDGQVTSRLVVERAETLDLLRRDAPALERALHSAGLQPDRSGLEFSLRDQSGGSRTPPEYPVRPNLLIVPDEDVAVREAVRRGYGVLRGLGGGVDIRV